MAYADTSNQSELLKTFYTPGINDYLNNDTVVATYLDRTSEGVDVAGKSVTLENHYGRSKGTGARAEGGSLPTADYQKFKTSTVPLKYDYGVIRVSGQQKAATRMDAGAYGRVLDVEIRGIANDLAQERNRKIWGQGYGVLARWHTTTNDTTYLVQRKYWNNSATYGGDGFGSTFGAKYIKPNGNSSAVPVVMTTGGGVITAATVDDTDIDVSAVSDGTFGSTDYDTITCTNPAVTEDAGTFYVRPAVMASITAGSDAGAGRLEMMGLSGIVNNKNVDDDVFFDGTNSTFTTSDPLQGLDVDSYSWFKSQVDFNGGTRYSGQRSLDWDLMQGMFDKVEIVAGKDIGPNLIMCRHPVRREVVAMYRADGQRIITMELKNGFTGIEYNGVPIVVDKDCIDGCLFFLTTDYLKFYQMTDGYDWMTDDQGGILRVVEGYDYYTGTLFCYEELGCTRRDAQGVIADLAYQGFD